MKNLRLTFGKKLILVYLFMISGVFSLTYTVGYAIVRNRVLNEILGDADLTMNDAPALMLHYWEVVNSILFLICIVLAAAFFLIYMVNIIPMRKLYNAARQFSIHSENPKIHMLLNDEYRDLAEALNVIGDDLNNFENYQKAFISNISHDFRSPLTSIRGYAQAMLDGTIPIDSQEKYLGIILSETDRLTNLTSNILELNSFDQHSIVLDKTNFNIWDTIHQTIDTLEGTAEKKGISFTFAKQDKKDFIVFADEAKIHQVLYNLIDNAIKFSHNNSFIYIETRKKGDKIFVSVKDSGIGIPKDNVNKVFDRFYKTDLSRGKDKKGTGLGLSISREIIESHGQTINVVSTEGVGTEFIFTLKKGLSH